ncbi:MAG TPA: hypothetical protein PK275_03125 [Chitinophagaceae bacterium]|nr:hypothetical protein [Chitinophagaceae bacterium]
MAKSKDTKPRNDELMNYLFRPAKNIERKMLCEAMNRLSVISDVKHYQYVGFGSVYFADFTLFHKQLGIQKLISIECEEDMETRVRFNQPYSCIDVMPGWSYEMLPEVDWGSSKSILWLDYTETLKGYMFKDMATFFQRALSGSMFIISVNVDLRDTQPSNKTTTQKIVFKLGKDIDVRKRIRSSSIKKEMTKNDYYSIIRSVIDNEVKEIITERNKLESKERFEYKQLFNFLYQDGQAMLTVGGVLFSENDKEKIERMNFKNLEFIVPDEKYFEIKVPHLTYREIHAIDKHLPNFNNDAEAREKALKELKGVVSDDAIHKYAKIYRYYPNYTEANL